MSNNLECIEVQNVFFFFLYPTKQSSHLGFSVAGNIVKRNSTLTKTPKKCNTILKKKINGNPHQNKLETKSVS